MRIKGLWKYVEDNHLSPHNLKDCSVVIDGQNHFYNKYKESGLPFEFGCESNRYAQYLRDYLGMFIRANVKCYIIFKGGHEDIDKKFRSIDDKNHISGEDFAIGDRNADIVLPVFMKSVYKEVLDELEFDFVVCQYESKRDCIAFAQNHDIPIISFDAEYCFSGVPYIPSTTLNYNASSNSISCGLFSLDRFMDKYPGLDKERLAMFIVLTDQNIFKENFFLNFFKHVNIPLNNYKRIAGLLVYLPKNSKEHVMREISKFIKFQDKRKFLKEENKIKSLIGEEITGGIAVEYLNSNNNVRFIENDPKWFVKGVASKFIAIPYINLYRSNIVLGSGATANNKCVDPLLLSLDIIQYAYDLLTDFENEGFEFVSQQSWLAPNTKGDKNNLKTKGCVKKPNYTAIESVFENGWDEICSLGLFDHFLRESLQHINIEYVQKFPADSRLLIVALVYFMDKKNNNNPFIVPSVLLSYIMLNVVFQRRRYRDDNIESTKTMKGDIINKEVVITADCEVAERTMRDFFVVENNNISKIFDREFIHPLVEFQHCLEELNYLNYLCGSPYVPTKYSKTFNGTFVYKIMYGMNKEYYLKNCVEFVREMLQPAKTVLLLFNIFVNFYNKIFKVKRK